jgi:hypothetical protein
LFFSLNIHHQLDQLPLTRMGMWEHILRNFASIDFFKLSPGRTVAQFGACFFEEDIITLSLVDK